MLAAGARVLWPCGFPGALYFLNPLTFCAGEEVRPNTELMGDRLS